MSGPNPNPNLNLNPDVLRVELPADLKYLSTLAACVQDAARRTFPDEAMVYEINLATGELFSNIIIHACESDPQRRVTLVMYLYTEQFIAEFYDTGAAFDFPVIVPPVVDPPQERGMGLFLIHHLMDEVSYRPHEDYNVWRLVKKVG